jgi:hypothetical protein
MCLQQLQVLWSINWPLLVLVQVLLVVLVLQPAMSAWLPAM